METASRTQEKCNPQTYVLFNFQNSHAICDIGLSIIKRLSQKEDYMQEMISSVSLPPMLYKPYEKKEGDDSQVSFS